MRMYDIIMKKRNGESLTDREIRFFIDGYTCGDIPDYQVMKRCGYPCCPNDAAPEIKSISCYVSPFDGGKGCGRDVIEQVLKAQGKWMNESEAFGW